MMIDWKKVVCLLPCFLSVNASALPKPTDRVYAADQISNTVSVLDPSSNTLLGQISLGNSRPDVLSPIYKGEVNVHGLGFSPDHKTLLVISTASNAATFIDTQTNKVKGTVYVGRSPHEGFFTPDGKEAWVVVRGEDYLSVIDTTTFREKSRIQTTTGPGMVIFHPNGKIAFVCNSFNPVVEVIDLSTRKVVKSIPVVSPFSPFLQVTPDGREIWLTHKDVGKVTRIDAEKWNVIGTIDTGFITNHLAFAKVGSHTFAYVTVGGEDLVKVYDLANLAKPTAEIKVGALPHGIWASDDSSRLYVGLENGDSIAVIDSSTNSVVATVPAGQAPQALVYVSNAVEKGDGKAGLKPRPEGPSNATFHLRPKSGETKGLAVVRNLGPVDSFEINIFKAKPDSFFEVYLGSKERLLAIVKTNEKGMGSATVIGPAKTLAPDIRKNHDEVKLVVMEKGQAFNTEKALLLSK